MSYSYALNLSIFKVTKNIGRDRNNNMATKKQHYIPQVYLRGFSPEYNKKNSTQKDKYTIYCYDINSKKQNDRAIPIKSICYEKNLYEVTGSDGNIVLPNYLETWFSKMEQKFGEFRSKLERKVFIEDNYKTKCFLTNEEKIFWFTYIITQIIRLPQTLEIAENEAKKILQVNSQQAKNIARIFCLPFFKVIDENSIESRLINIFFEAMKNMSIGVGVDKDKKLITSDKPVYIDSKSFPCKEFDKIIFPVSSEICLFLFSNENKGKYQKNFLFPIESEVREEIIKAMTHSSSGKLYSNHILDKGERECIKETLRATSRNRL